MFSLPATRAIALRVLREVFRDTRSRTFVAVVPGVLVVFVRYLFDSGEAFSPTGAMMIGVFPAMSMYMVASTLVVRERNRGTLEAVLATPAGRRELVGGYLAASLVICMFQAVFTVGLGYSLGGVQTESPWWLLGVVTLLCALFGTALGLVCSAICQTESQASQLVPGFMVPQLIICGVFWPVAKMSDWLQGLERWMPFSPITRAMTAAREHSYGGMELVTELTAMSVLTALSLVGAAAVIKRRTA
ncbi:ABC transporter permease [Streptomyces sp. CC219B]|uniref:ABC transporter permease n=1 Tax=Streptomyces sp. CC219B TaxID=3044574 RepID=UPI0024A8DBB2|nr:ABC transporter permease [Streptomyces sp. CC219B]